MLRGYDDWLSSNDLLSKVGPAEKSSDFEVVSKWVLEKMRLAAKSA